MQSRFAVRRGIQLVLIAGVVVSASVHQPALATHAGTNGKIAFWEYNKGQIKSIEADGSGRSVIAGGPADASGPAWSPDGSQIAYASGSNSLVVADADGSNPTEIVGPDDGIQWLVSPSWSGDGTQIAVLSHLKGAPGAGRVTIITVADGSLTQIGPDKALSFDGLDWSSNGTIAFLTGFEARLHVIQPDGTGATVIDGYFLFDPSWSPNGARLAVAHRVGRGRTDIMTMRADGTRRRRLTSSGARWEWTPAWSPDGTMIAFSRTQRSEDGADNDVWVIGADGSDPHRITDTGDQDEFALDWQPIP